MQAILWFLAVQAPDLIIRTEHEPTPSSRQVIAQETCTPHIIQFRHRTTVGPGGRSEVTHVIMDGGEVWGAAAQLQERAAGRSIQNIGLLRCGHDGRPDGMRGVMELSSFESSHLRLDPRVWFWIRRIDGEWRLEF
jgi:hypothetical protein